MKWNLYLALKMRTPCEVNSSFAPPLELPANLFGLWIKPSYGNYLVNKKAGRKDKHGASVCFIVGKSTQ
jgi:hypothetical protein